VQWNSDPKVSWVAIYRLCVLGLLTINLTVLLEHNVNLVELFPRFFAACRSAAP